MTEKLPMDTASKSSNDTPATTASKIGNETSTTDRITPRQMVNTNNTQSTSKPTSHAHPIFRPAPPESTSRYSRQLLVPSISLKGHQRILASRILVIGLGGLGSPAALYLAGAGVGKLGLLDYDVVETSNLHRQIVHTEESVARGLTKVQSAVEGCMRVNSERGRERYVEHEMNVGASEMGRELLAVLERYDVVLDCTDNPATRYAISDACVVAGKVLVCGAAQRLEGQMCVLNYEEDGERGMCYRCAFPVPPPPEMSRGCGEIGILGPVVGVVGTMMASEALRIVVRGREERKPILLLYSAWARESRSMWRAVGMRGRRKDCLACGDEEVLSGLGKRRITRDDLEEGRVDYVRFCGVVESLKVLGEGERLSGEAFLDKIQVANNGMRIIDVRENHEVELGPKIEGSVNIPLPKVLSKDGNVTEVMDGLLHDPDVEAVVFVCQQGNDSQLAAKKFLDRYAESGEKEKRKFIGDLTGGFVALQRLIDGLNETDSTA